MNIKKLLNRMNDFMITNQDHWNQMYTSVGSYNYILSNYIHLSRARVECALERERSRNERDTI